MKYFNDNLLSRKNENFLLKNAIKISGYSLKELIKKSNFFISNNLKKDKGWIGKFLEKFLGSTSNNKREKDFPTIGIELKTVPINRQGKTLQDSFICMVHPIKGNNVTWEKSYIKYKLQKILWIPVQSDNNIPIMKRKICCPFLWSPNILENKILKNDWEEIMEKIFLGKIKNITLQKTMILKILSKGVNKISKTCAINEYGKKIKITPLAFYFKKKFTTELIYKNYFI